MQKGRKIIMNKKVASIKPEDVITYKDIAKATAAFIIRETKYLDKELVINFAKSLIREEPTYKIYYDTVSLLLFNYCLESEDYVPLLSAWIDKLDSVFMETRSPYTFEVFKVVL